MEGPCPEPLIFPLPSPTHPFILPGQMRRIETVTTRFQSLEIWKSAQATEFRVAGAIHAWHHRERFLTGLAWDLIAAGALLRPEGPPRSILMLGLAGGTAFRALRHLLPDCRLTAIDIDGEIVDLARKHMSLDELRIEHHTADAREWLARNKRRFDVVIDDIYLAGSEDVFRPHGWDAGLMRHLRRAVHPGGLLAINLVTGPGHRAVQSKARRILREAFPVVRNLRSPRAMNEVLVAGEEVAAARCLREYSSRFGDRSDRVFWSRIKVRKI